MDYYHKTSRTGNNNIPKRRSK